MGKLVQGKWIPEQYDTKKTGGRFEDVVSVWVVDPFMGEDGWAFTVRLGCGPDPVNGARHLDELYVKVKPDDMGRVTVPVLSDKEEGTLVNNESPEIIRILNRAFDAWGDVSVDLYPEALREEIDAVNERVYETVNNGVYRCGFATTQKAYEEAFDPLFETLDWLEERLRRQRSTPRRARRAPRPPGRPGGRGL